MSDQTDNESHTPSAEPSLAQEMAPWIAAGEETLRRTLDRLEPPTTGAWPTADDVKVFREGARIAWTWLKENPDTLPRDVSAAVACLSGAIPDLCDRAAQLSPGEPLKKTPENFNDGVDVKACLKGEPTKEMVEARTLLRTKYDAAAGKGKPISLSWDEAETILEALAVAQPDPQGASLLCTICGTTVTRDASLLCESCCRKAGDDPLSDAALRLDAPAVAQPDPRMQELDSLARRAVQTIQANLRRHGTDCQCPACVAIGVLYGYHCVGVAQPDPEWRQRIQVGQDGLAQPDPEKNDG